MYCKLFTQINAPHFNTAFEHRAIKEVFNLIVNVVDFRESKYEVIYYVWINTLIYPAFKW